jgi:hypothetical protein
MLFLYAMLEFIFVIPCINLLYLSMSSMSSSKLLHKFRIYFNFSTCYISNSDPPTDETPPASSTHSRLTTQSPSLECPVIVSPLALTASSLRLGKRSSRLG